ncbi:MAG: hypothetical protein AB7G80_08525 [Dongiaceae bacterium]
MSSIPFPGQLTAYRNYTPLGEADFTQAWICRTKDVFQFRRVTGDELDIILRNQLPHLAEGGNLLSHCIWEVRKEGMCAACYLLPREFAAEYRPLAWAKNHSWGRAFKPFWAIKLTEARYFKNPQGVLLEAFEGEYIIRDGLGRMRAAALKKESLRACDPITGKFLADRHVYWREYGASQTLLNQWVLLERDIELLEKQRKGR